MQSLSHYEILGVTTDASADQIKTAFRAQSKALHPDKNKHGGELMKRVNEAYSVIGDQAKRQRYDFDLARSVQHSHFDFSAPHFGFGDSTATRRQISELRRQLRETKTSEAYHRRRADEAGANARTMKIKTITLEQELLFSKREALRSARKIGILNEKLESVSCCLVEERLRLNELQMRHSSLVDEKKQREIAHKIELDKMSGNDRSTCYRCGGDDKNCSLCRGSGNVHGRWTPCLACRGQGCIYDLKNRTVPCGLCEGVGAKRGISWVSCNICEGKGCAGCLFKGRVCQFGTAKCPMCDRMKDSITECMNCHGSRTVAQSFRRNQPNLSSSLNMHLLGQQSDNEEIDGESLGSDSGKKYGGSSWEVKFMASPRVQWLLPSFE